MAKVQQSAFAQLRNKSKSLTEKLQGELEKANAGGRQKDPAFWEPTLGKDGNGFAILRFLPAPQNEEVPFARRFSHQFKGPGGWYIELSLTSLGQEDPVSEHNRELWATETEANKKTVRERKRKLEIISNIYVVKDAANPETEGKTFKYKYGKKIFDMITDAMVTNEAEGKVGFNPFDPDNGANFKLRIRKVDAGPGKPGFNNYDKSEWDKQGPFADEATMEAAWQAAYPLLAEVAPEKFKPYDELKTKFEKVIGLGRTVAPRGPAAEAPEAASTSAPRQLAVEDDGLGGATGEDPDLARFRQLARDE